MLPIFKIYNLIEENEIEHIYVFLNNEWLERYKDNIETTILELERAIPEKNMELLQDIFLPTELEAILSNTIPVTFLPHPIHIDDTIATVKSKIIERTAMDISFPEIYLFGIHEEKLNMQELYNKLTQNDEIPLTKDRMVQFLQNFVNFNIGDFRKKEQEEYTSDDLFPYTETIQLIKFPIGQKMIIKKKYPFTVSPFDTFINDPILAKYGDKITSTENKNLLLEYGSINANIIFMCTASNVLTNDAFDNLKTKIYFPLLYKEKINTLTLLEANKQGLLEKNTKYINSKTEKYNKNINFLYNLFYNPLIKLPSTRDGIQYIHFIIHPIAVINFPIDIIFKLIHATEIIPLAKWNPGKRRENIYRLYAPKISKDGRKIPTLPKSEILKLRPSIGRRRSVSLTIQIGTKQYIICEFYPNGVLV